MTLIKQPTPENILLAARSLKDGALIGLPTETVYGLAADAENERAVRRIYEVKGRPFDHPLIVHIGSINYLSRWARDIPEYAWKLATKFWPGPMTLVLKRSLLAQNFITGNQDSVGLRMPDHPIASEVLQNFHSLGGNGLAMPSANKFGKVSATSAKFVISDIGMELNNKIDFVLDGGYSEIGIESTVVSCLDNEIEILRSGFVVKSELLNAVYPLPISTKRNKHLRVSGNMNSHYAPKASVVFEGKSKIGDGFIALKNIKTPLGCFRLISPENPADLAREIYQAFRLADKLKLRRIYVKLPNGEGIEEAIRERVIKASFSK